MNAKIFIPLLSAALAASGCGSSGPTKDELEQAIQTEQRASYAAQLAERFDMNLFASAKDRQNSANANSSIAKRLVVHLKDKQCSEVSAGKFSCDVLLTVGDSAHPTVELKNQQMKYELVKLGGEWRANRSTALF